MSNGTKRTGLEQGRAAYAYQCAESGSNIDKRKEYKSYVKKMPMLIKTNGLGAAVAFAFAKGSKDGKPKSKDPWALLYTQLDEWLRTRTKINATQNQLAKALTESLSADYRAATIEALALLNWMKRFADALIEGDPQE